MKNNKKLRILTSVSDRSGLVEFLNSLKATFSLEIVATFGTAEYLKKENVEVTSVEEITGYPRLFSGRIKMIHLPIFAAILADQNNPEHLKQLKKLKVKPFDMVIVNLYPLKEKILKKSPPKSIIENIDIGGPAAIRSAAKNYHLVIPVCDPGDYAEIGEELKKKGKLNLSFKRNLAVKVFALTGEHDKDIIKYLSSFNNK